MIVEFHEEVPGLLGDPWSVGFVVIPTRCILRVGSSMKKRTYSRLKNSAQAAKFAVDGFSRVLAAEMEPFGIRVVVV